jgi:signal transduction histidine kinase
MNRKLIKLFALISIFISMLVVASVMIISYSATEKNISLITKEIHTSYLTEIVNNFKNDLVSGNLRFFRNQISILIEHEVFSDYEIIEGNTTISSSENFLQNIGLASFYKIQIPIYFDDQMKVKWGQVNLLIPNRLNQQRSKLILSKVGSFILSSITFIFVFFSILFIIWQQIIFSLSRGIKQIFNDEQAKGEQISSLFWEPTLLQLKKYKNTHDKLIKNEAEYQKQVDLGILASQTAHDIRSPLSALTMVVGTLKEIPEEKRLLIRNATQRINDIANDLLQKGKEDGHSGPTNSADVTPALTTEFIPVLIDILISEKRMQYRENTGLEIDVDLKDSFGSFAQINSNELKRVISNLINNAVEAFDDHQGRITVGVKKIPTGSANSSNSPQKVEISVKDNGRGIPKHILEKLGQMGVTHGKEGSQSGSGLGVYHAKKTAESMGGTFEIDSLEGKGTTIKIILPLAESPNWFANKIDLTAKKYLISLDDDISIHQIWAGRLSSLGLNDIEHLRFQSGEAFKHYVVSNMTKLKETLFLVDYELLNQSLTGLDIIDELGIEKYSILVTSRYEESSIQERASRLRLPILPKALAGFVPFERQQPKELFDWVLLDDDDLIKMTWEFAAKEYNKTFKYFKTPEELQTYKSKLNPEQKIFIDSNLGHGVKGEDIAQQLSAEGFKNLYLATGYAPEQFPKMDFIKAVVGKEPPGE